MATTVGSPSNHHSPRGSGFSAAGGGGGVRSPLHSPWAKIVRGELESVPAVHLSPTSSSLPEQTHFTDCSSSSKAAAAETATSTAAVVASTDNPAAEECSDGNNGNAAQPKKPVWNKLSNGVIEGVPPVMGASSWPALSESTRASAKSSAADSSSKPVSNGSIPVPQGPVIPNAPQKHVTNSNSNPTSRHVPARQRSMRRGTGGNGGGRPAQSSFIHPPPPPTPPPPPPFPLISFSQANYGNLLPVLPNAPPREPPYPTRPIAGFAPSHAVSNQFSHRNPSRRPRGEGHYHNRREHDRRDPELNSRSSNGRDLHMQQHQRAPPPPPPRGFMRPPPPGSPAFITPSPMRPFANPMAFEMRPSPFYIIPTLHPEPFRSMPFIAHAPPPPGFIPISEPLPLSRLLVNQIDYYFSDINLETDNYLKSNMDELGWVPITVIASFPRVMKLSTDIDAILEALRTSVVVEVKDGKVRRRNEWMKYINSTGQGSTVPNSQLNITTAEHNIEAIQSRGSSEESTGELHPSNDED